MIVRTSWHNPFVRKWSTSVCLHRLHVVWQGIVKTKWRLFKRLAFTLWRLKTKFCSGINGKLSLLFQIDLLCSQVKHLWLFPKSDKFVSCFKSDLLYSEVRKGLFLVSKQICCILKSDKLISCFKSDLLYSEVRKGYFLVSKQICCIISEVRKRLFLVSKHICGILKSDKLISCLKTDLLYSEVRQINFLIWNRFAVLRSH